MQRVLVVMVREYGNRNVKDKDGVINCTLGTITIVDEEGLEQIIGYIKNKTIIKVNTYAKGLERIKTRVERSKVS